MRLQASRIALCAAPGGGGPLKYEDQAWAELLVLSVPRPTSSSISGNAPEWRYLGPHRALPGFGAWSGQIAACTRSSIFQAPRGSFSSPVRYPVAGVCQVRISEPWKREPLDVPAAASPLLPSESLVQLPPLGESSRRGKTAAPRADCPIGPEATHAHIKPVIGRGTRPRPSPGPSPSPPVSRTVGQPAVQHPRTAGCPQLPSGF